MTQQSKVSSAIPTKHHEGIWKGVAQSHGQAHIVCSIEIPHIPVFLSQPEDTEKNSGGWCESKN